MAMLRSVIACEQILYISFPLVVTLLKITKLETIMYCFDGEKSR